MAQDEFDKIGKWLHKECGRHRSWRRIWSILYFTVAASTIVTGALTTAIAGLSDGLAWQPERTLMYATALAAATTILAGAEKVLKLREKWDLHRNIQVALELIELKRGRSSYDDDKVISDIERIAHQYSAQLAELNLLRPDDDQN